MTRPNSGIGGSTIPPMGWSVSGLSRGPQVVPEQRQGLRIARCVVVGRPVPNRVISYGRAGSVGAVASDPVGSPSCCTDSPPPSSEPCARTRPTPRSPATACSYAPATSAGPLPGSTPGCHWGCGHCARSRTSCARRWTPWAARRSTSRHSCRPSPTRPPGAGTTTAPPCSSSATARTGTTCWPPPTRRCSPSRSRTSTPPTRTCRPSSTRSRPSTATRPAPAPASSAAASSS